MVKQKMQGIFDGVISELEKIRSEIAALKTEREQIENSLLPKAEAAERMGQFVDRLAEEFDPASKFGAARSANGRIGDIFGFDLHPAPKRFLEQDPGIDAGPLLAFLFGDLIKERLADAFQSMDYVEGPHTEKRPETLAKIDKKLHALETSEEAMIMDAEEAGIELLRRPDADPAIILEVVR